MPRTRTVLAALCLGTRLMLPADTAAQGQAGVGLSSPDSLREAQASGLAPAQLEYRFPFGRERFRDWALNAFGLSAIVGSATSTAWGQCVTNEPLE